MMDSARPQKEVPGKLQLMMQMFELEKKMMAAMLEADRLKRAGDLIAAKAKYREQIERGREHLDLLLLHNQHHPPPFEIVPAVQPVVDAMLTLADVLQSLGELENANLERENALKLSDTYLSLSTRIDTKRSLAASLTSQARFNEALVILSDCKDYLLRQNMPIPIVRITLDMVDILNWLGDYSRSLDELNQASTLLQSVTGDRKPTQTDIAEALIRSTSGATAGISSDKNAADLAALYRASIEVNYYRALVLKALQKYDEAEQHFKLVLPEYEKLGVGAAIEFQFAAIAVARGEHRKALEISQRLETVFINDNNFRPKLASLLKLQAEVLSNLEDNVQALKCLDRGIHELSSTYYDPDELWKLLFLKGRILNKTGQRKEALETFLKSAETVNKLRRAPLGYRLDSTYLKDKIPLFHEAIALANDMNKARECCNLMEMVKSRILTTTLGIPLRKERPAADDDQLKQRVYQLTRDLEALEYNAFKTGILVDEVESKKTAMLSERDQVLQQIRISDPRWRTITEPVPFDLDSIQDALSMRDYNALSLFDTQDGIVGVLITNGECMSAEVKMKEEEKQSFQLYLDNLQCAPIYVNPTLNDPSSKALALDAEHFIASELLEKGLQCKGLVIVPHGPLHLLPWAGLRYKGRRLFEYCPISILPNLSTIIHTSGSLSKSPRIAIIGPPDYSSLAGFQTLPGARTECKRITQLYPKTRIIGKMLTGKTSTEKAFWDIAKYAGPSGAILHIACHGVSEPDEPMHSGLILGDGRIDASEIALSSLQFDEVILSACSTGWRPQKVQDVELLGDDILGLPGAFLEAGARSVLVSIPPADDKAGSEFMIRYHAQRSKGKKPMAAMQYTQKSMLEDSSFKPFQWIGFVLYGCQ